jgi:hypothetical protein
VLCQAQTDVGAQIIPKSCGKPSELVITQYEKLISDGALLTPEGWKKAGKIFAKSNVYPAQGTIGLTSTGGILGEDWNKENHAPVETKWTDYLGSMKRMNIPCGGNASAC